MYIFFCLFYSTYTYNKSVYPYLFKYKSPQCMFDAFKHQIRSIQHSHSVKVSSNVLTKLVISWLLFIDMLLLNGTIDVDDNVFFFMKEFDITEHYLYAFI